ncbi:btk-binding protein-related [Anaeramoeba flamelloides]|uniref:Btk-binding protein-related n=1 Tax=Anaeramoeba flamelloides TaxID=1746091 RepID=A0ABQ8YWY1_9EUKA|nr:btk-binding protein-related [Anaeramoeba flamelloides]
MGLYVGSTCFSSNPTAVKNFKGSGIITVGPGYFHAILITNEGQTFGCGHNKKNGLGIYKSIFTLIPQLKENKAVQLEIAISRNLVLTDQNELYIWGIINRFYPTTEPKNDRKLQTKIILPSPYELGFCFPRFQFHKGLVECRTKLTINQIQKKLLGEKSATNKEHTLSFLKWVYNDEISDIEKLEQTFDLLELTFPPSVDNTLEKEIAQLYKDDDSKDFKILYKIDNKEEEVDDDLQDQENEEGNYEEIPVHTFILLARSGLFREMFDYVNEKDNTNKFQDYTKKAIQRLKILIEYFYTNPIELTTKEDSELIVDKLFDAIEYCQLNEQCNFEPELNKIKKQFDLNEHVFFF